jgi:Holliday junction resolvasome RuvABC endonuclease subunit
VTRVLGLDVSLTSTGVALPNGRTLVICPPRLRPVPERLDHLLNEVRRLVAAHAPQVCAIEGYSLGGLRGIAPVRLAEAGGLVRWALWRRGVPVVDVPPSTLKVYAVGHGHAEKAQMVDAVQRYAPDVVYDDQADAWACRALLLHALGEPVWPASPRAGESVAVLHRQGVRQLVLAARPPSAQEAPCL